MTRLVTIAPASPPRVIHTPTYATGPARDRGRRPLYVRAQPEQADCQGPNGT